jgi:hypothetical protein
MLRKTVGLTNIATSIQYSVNLTWHSVSCGNYDEVHMCPALETKRAYNTFVGNTLGNQSLRRSRSSWKCNIWIASREAGCEDSR